MRTLIIGDIHGNLETLEDALSNANFDINNDRIICLGDYVDEFIMIHKREFFDQLKYFHVENNRLFVHAGYDLTLGFNATARLKKEALLWDRTLYRLALQYWHMDNNFKLSDKEKENLKIGEFDRIYIGHTSTINDGFHYPQIMGNIVNLDQGCKRKGVLSIWEDETDRFYQNV